VKLWSPPGPPVIIVMLKN